LDFHKTKDDGVKAAFAVSYAYYLHLLKADNHASTS